MHERPLRIGFVGSGCIARFHFSSLEGARNVRFARRCGDDFVEHQIAESGPMPVVVGGVAVVGLIMALYKSADEYRTVALPDESLDTYVPLPARS